MSEEEQVPSQKVASSEEIPSESLPEQEARTSVIDLRVHPKFIKKHSERPPEGLDEDALFAKIKAAVLVLGARHERSWDHVRTLSGNVLPHTEEGEQVYRDLRIPRKKLDSQRARINQLRGRLHAAIRAGQLQTPDDIVPWHATPDEQENTYDKNYGFLQRDDVSKLIKTYLPFLRQLESVKNEDALHKLLDSLEERTHAIMNLLQSIRQLEYDHLLFLQLFGEKQNPAFMQSFQDREQGIVKKKPVKLSKEKRDRAKAREQAQNVSEGAQMRMMLEYNGAEITLERTRAGWKVMTIKDPKHIFSKEEMEDVGREFYNLHAAPDWIYNIAKEKGLV